MNDRQEYTMLVSALVLQGMVTHAPNPPAAAANAASYAKHARAVGEALAAEFFAPQSRAVQADEVDEDPTNPAETIKDLVESNALIDLGGGMYQAPFVSTAADGAA